MVYLMRLCGWYCLGEEEFDKVNRGGERIYILRHGNVILVRSVGCYDRERQGRIGWMGGEEVDDDHHPGPWHGTLTGQRTH